jgi:hypothetical protein
MVEPHANMKGSKVIEDTWWLQYICCGGCGFGAFSDPLCGADVVDLTSHASCNTTDIINDDGLCGCIQVSMDSTAQFQFPPVEGAPKCVCFNTKLAGDGSVSKTKGMFDYGKIFDQTWWYIYIFCCGYGLNGLQAGGRPFIGAYEKFLIVEGSMSLQPNEWPGSGNGMKSCMAGLCEGDEVCMSGVETFLCVWEQFKIPPEQGAPKCKCFNKQLA